MVIINRDEGEWWLARLLYPYAKAEGYIPSNYVAKHNSLDLYA